MRVPITPCRRESIPFVTLSLFSGVHDFFHSGTWAAVRIILVAFVVLFWFATVYWVWKDAHRRIDDLRLVGFATLFGAVPLLGPMIYMLFRPPEYLEDVRERELEIRAIESRLGGPDMSCSVCGCEIEPDFLVCPVCTTKLRSACTTCTSRSSPPGRCARTARRRSWTVPSRSHRGLLDGPARRALEPRVSSPPAWRSNGPSSSRSPTPSSGTSPARSSRASSGADSSCARRRLLVASRELGATHYAEHEAKPFFGELVDFITSGPTLAFVLEGEGAIATARKTIGVTNPADADPGSLRGEFGLAMPNNLVHGSDSPESAEREIGLWFPDGLV